MNNEVKRYVRNLVADIIDKRDAIQSAIFKAGLPGTIIKKGFTLEDMYKQIGFSDEIIKTNLTKGIRIIDKSIIENNEYYKNISLEKVNLNGITLKSITYKQNEIDIVEQEFIDDKAIQIPLAVHSEPLKTISLQQHGQTWMSITHNEILTMENDINKASGKVFTAGLGLGYFTYMCAIKPNVESITVVEIQDDVIEIFQKYILPQFGKYASKVKIIKCDYFDYIQKVNLKEKFDYSFIDIYFNPIHGLSTYGITQEVLFNQQGDGVVSFWLEENFENIIRESLLLAILFKRVNENSNYKCRENAYYRSFGNHNKIALILKSISYIENKNITIESIEDVDNLIFEPQSDLYKDIASYKSLLCFDSRPKAKNKSEFKMKSNHIPRKKKLSRKQRKSLNR